MGPCQTLWLSSSHPGDSPCQCLSRTRVRYRFNAVVAAFAEERTRRTCTSIKTGLSQEIRDLIAGKCLEARYQPGLSGHRSSTSFHLFFRPPLPFSPWARFLVLVLIAVTAERLSSRRLPSAISLKGISFAGTE